MDIFDHIRSQDITAVDPYFAIHIPLLLGERQTAVQVARQWVSKWEAGELTERNTASEFSDEDMLRIIATDGEWIPKKGNR